MGLLDSFSDTRMFPRAGNAVLSENILMAKALDIVRERLPFGWTAVFENTQRSEAHHDVVIRLSAPDGREGVLAVEVKQRLDPRRSHGLVSMRTPEGYPLLAVAPWMSQATREILRSQGVNLVDLTGSVRLVLSEPGLFIETAGADRDPWPEASRVTLRGAKAARVVRTLCAGVELPLGVRALAAEAGTTPGYVSKLLGMLDQQAAVHRTAKGQVGRVDLRRLLEAWAEDAPLETRTSVSSWIAPRGPTALMEKLRQTTVRYAVTGSLAASKRAPVAAPRIISIYVDDPEAFAAEVYLRPADAGSNVLLLVPDDSYPFEEPWTEDGVHYAALPQVVADLLSGPGRGPAEAEALLSWMSDNEVRHA